MPVTLRSIVERAIAISKQFETSSKARERQQRANESLPLTAQADAAFLMKLAKMSLAGGGLGYERTDKKEQLNRTLAIMRKAVELQKEMKEVKGTA